MWRSSASAKESLAEITDGDSRKEILDLFGINYYSNLYYGNSIFSDDYSNVVNDSAYIVSEKIIRGRYFNKN